MSRALSGDVEIQWKKYRKKLFVVRDTTKTHCDVMTFKIGIDSSSSTNWIPFIFRCKNSTFRNKINVKRGSSWKPIPVCSLLNFSHSFWQISIPAFPLIFSFDIIPQILVINTNPIWNFHPFVEQTRKFLSFSLFSSPGILL